MNRVLPLEIKVNIMKESLHLSRVDEIAANYGVSPESVYYWFNHKVKPALGEILKNDPPGPARKLETETEQEVTKEDRSIEDRPKNLRKMWWYEYSKEWYLHSNQLAIVIEYGLVGRHKKSKYSALAVCLVWARNGFNRTEKTKRSQECLVAAGKTDDWFEPFQVELVCA